jgi:hypothetical protein
MAVADNDDAMTCLDARRASSLGARGLIGNHLRSVSGTMTDTHRRG